ncbi:hypothetical protein NOR_03503 [Metarhizium rileyi]|uniref:Uncharacterized protein n=1 Tax=Metarhizium rileyi (strain RCEF 4871) TaxID=1649241 RepID=A0A167F3Q1_METRR|nr:hypothetical protein NOR_03503 [Metarhizium rileyi RCEF 4871]
MSQQPSTPVKVSSAAANNTPATLDPDLRSQINTVLLRDGHVTNSTNWPTQIQSHALTLLRSGEVTTYPALLRRILDDVREATNPNPSKTPNGDAKRVNGSTIPEKPNLAVPPAVIDEALRITRESLEAVCEIDEHTTS